MAREEEIKEVAEKFAFNDKTETPEFYDAMNDYLLQNKQAEKTMTKEEYIRFLNENLLVPAHNSSDDISDEFNYLKFPQKAFIDKHPKSDIVNKHKFIEKACEWLCKNMTDSAYLGANTLMTLHKVDFVERFRKAMNE